MSFRFLVKVGRSPGRCALVAWVWVAGVAPRRPTSLLCFCVCDLRHFALGVRMDLGREAWLALRGPCSDSGPPALGHLVSQPPASVLAGGHWDQLRPRVCLHTTRPEDGGVVCTAPCGHHAICRAGWEDGLRWGRFHLLCPWVALLRAVPSQV